MSAPEQPTPEARAALAEAELEARCAWYHQNPGVPHMQALGWPYHLDYHLARALDRFAAQAAERLRRCAICGFMVDTTFAAEKPSVHVGQGGKQ